MTSDAEARYAAPEQPDRPSYFPISMRACVGRELQLSQSPAADWELIGDGQRVAWLRLYGAGEVAHVACREGSWSLKKRRKYGWEFVIESSDGRHVGWYSGHHWLPGGTIILGNGDRIALRRSLDLGWNLRVKDTRERFVRLSRYGPNGLTLSLTVRSLPPEIHLDAPMVVLTTCAVLTLTALAMPIHVANGS